MTAIAAKPMRAKMQRAMKIGIGIYIGKRVPGARQSRAYRDVLVQTIGELVNDPDVAGSKARDEIMPGLRTLYVARHGRRGRHFLMYRVVAKSTIEIVRILHDRMDLQRHIPANESGE